ncbi:hypothetical protein HNQ69_000109 [Bartonella callosciuri]|uniref:Uncharacterized protein n=1 Tax=Bartonella callosciuri TaxID=686223 RepID=A0A840NSS3_9HYPH|nr:hypothetical protein [Bartonella callosciuri]
MFFPLFPFPVLLTAHHNVTTDYKCRVVHKTVDG